MRRKRRVVEVVVLLSLAACASQRQVKVGDGEKLTYKAIRPAVAFELLRDAPETLILDVRSRAEYAGPHGHLAGAANIPLTSLEQRLHELDGWRSRTFLVYGSNGEGRKAIRLLLSHDFRYPVLIAGGIGAWRAAGFGTVDGALPRPEPPPEANVAEDYQS